MLMRFDPFRELDTVSEALRRRGGAPTMPMDAYRDGDRFVVHFDLPGVDPDSIDLTVEKNVLSVQADRVWQVPEDREVVVNERPQGHFSRQLFLGEGLDPEHVEAFYDKGVLTLFIPIAEQAKPRKVEVHAGGDAQAIEASSNETSSSESRQQAGSTAA